MCGIIKTKDPDKINGIKHRGIESQIVKHQDFFLGHSRLPIQTLEGDQYGQPIKLSNGSFLMYNGEIFNYPKIYSSDVAYLIDLFESQKIEGVLMEANSWDGFWSIVLVQENGTTFAFTDPLGKKQLYYNEEGEICSEIRPLVNGHKWDQFYKSSVFKWGYNTTDHTPYQGIKRILPNKIYQFGPEVRGFGWHDYFDWTPLDTGKVDLYELLYNSVESRLISKYYRIGVLISGGLDSTIIAHLLSEIGADVNYYSVENGESDYANLVADHYGVDLKYLNYDVDSDLKEIFKWNETPVDLGSVIPQHKLFSVIPEKIVLSGDGADELFGGYRRINTYDSQQSDIFEELPFYHLPRLDRASMRFTIELRSPFLSHDIVKYALGLPFPERKNKKCLKELFEGKIPEKVRIRRKLPLKNKDLVENPEQYKTKIFNLFYNENL